MTIEAASQLDSNSRTVIARSHVDAAEEWVRKLIHHQLLAATGNNYLTGGGVLKNPETIKLAGKISGDSPKYFREIDATTFEQASRIICHPERWQKHFSVALINAYPLGFSECDVFLGRLIRIRNDLQHGRPVSARQVEQAICYTNDLADSIKSFFKEHHMARDFDVPLFTRYVDNLGNGSTLEEVTTTMSSRIIDWRKRGKGDLYPGDTLIAEIEVDPTFDRGEYKVAWSVFGESQLTPGRTATVNILNRHVGEQFELTFQVKTNRDWHRSWGVDDRFTVLFRVLPPPISSQQPA